MELGGDDGVGEGLDHTSAGSLHWLLDLDVRLGIDRTAHITTLLSLLLNYRNSVSRAVPYPSALLESTTVERRLMMQGTLATPWRHDTHWQALSEHMEGNSVWQVLWGCEKTWQKYIAWCQKLYFEALHLLQQITGVPVGRVAVYRPEPQGTSAWV